MKIGILPLGRPTFDVPFAEFKLKSMLHRLYATGHELISPRTLLLDEDSARSAMDSLAVTGVDQILILQTTFTDASMAAAVGATFDQPLSIWAVPEPRVGGRLRLNAFCGLNLASHALGVRGRDFSWLYCDPGEEVADQIARLLSGDLLAKPLMPTEIPDQTEVGARVVQALQGRKIARLGEHPVGFDTCTYDRGDVADLAGVEIEELELGDLFDAARNASTEATQSVRANVNQQTRGLNGVDQTELERSLRLKVGLEDLMASGGYNAFAIRCWPETFTEYGGAVCGPAAMMGEAKIPCACEADVFGALSQLVLQETAQAPVFLSDVVDIDATDNTGVFWHCGQAPYSMRDPEVHAEATIHTNRKQPLLYQFPLKPGPVTFMRVSQAFGRKQMVLGFGEMLRCPMAFTGTSGVIQFARDAGEVLNDLISGGIEHHIAIAYGDHRETLRGVAGVMQLPLLEL
ncbi:MAG: L-fucose/L-arabinose isomerase family protein [Boseongicola sp.]